MFSGKIKSIYCNNNIKINYFNSNIKKHIMKYSYWLTTRLHTLEMNLNLIHPFSRLTRHLLYNRAIPNR